ncbi:MAG: PleD family two-component system response regulator [Syntrophobacteria bacterium]
MVAEILVVDDNSLIRNLLDKILAREGYEVILASNAEEAIELAYIRSPRVIVMDINMPGIDGLEACKRLKTIKKTQSIPVILMTGFELYEMAAIEAGADSFMTKPFDVSEITKRVSLLIRPR